VFILVRGTDRENPACSVASTTSRTSSSSQITQVMSSMTHAGSRLVVKMN
jgi:hypothetical protein